MQRKWMFLAMAAVAAAPIVLGAQDTTAPAPRVRRAPRTARGFALAMGENRGRIGVIVRTDANAESDKIGAKIEAVTPGGPADKAGLKVGDIITKFNGTSLGGVPSDDDEESGPGKKLVELAHQLDPGDTVQVEYRRGTDSKKATVVAAKLGDGRLRLEMGDPGMMVMPDMPDMHEMPDMTFFLMSPWGDLKLVGLNPDLGDYFGTKEGILVVKAPADSSLPLRGGDVIMSIGGRKPSSPEHAMRILRSYDKGETVSIEILRKQKRLTVAWKVPSRDDRSFRVREERHEHERDEQSAWRRLTRPRLRLQRV